MGLKISEVYVWFLPDGYFPTTPLLLIKKIYTSCHRVAEKIKT